MNSKIVTILAAGTFLAAAFAGCVGSDEEQTAGEAFSILGKTGDGEWTNETVVALVSEEITAENAKDAAGRAKTVESVSFKIDGVGAGAKVVWDFGDLTTETAGAEVTHTYAAPGACLVLATIGDASANITVAVNYHASGSGTVMTLPGGEVYQEGTSYIDYLFRVNEGAKKCEISMTGSGVAAETSDIDMALMDPSGKQIASSVGATAEEHITCKKMKPAGDFTVQIGQIAGQVYASIGEVSFDFTIDVLYA
ncbi:MAG: hypothetical protein CVT48_05460 [Thermoplasmata archaeon HGW-Thermoplasmata-1]|nr:MAG: hypothetical protein CVT48_05460 [Thermoplasmata archaeon HGW-Thermoplasmata-1]